MFIDIKYVILVGNACIYVVYIIKMFIKRIIYSVNYLIVKLTKKPKFKVGDQIEWYALISASYLAEIEVNSNDTYISGKINLVRISKKDSHGHESKRAQWVYDLGNERGTFAYQVSGDHLRLCLSHRRENAINKLLESTEDIHNHR